MLSWLSAVFFLPSLALALGTWSGTTKLFEIVYLLWWVGGPIQKVPALDFVGTAGTSQLPLAPLIYLALALLLFMAAVYGRRRQVLERHAAVNPRGSLQQHQDPADGSAG